jgi:AcrR family transcriptional regulator
MSSRRATPSTVARLKARPAVVRPTAARDAAGRPAARTAAGRPATARPAAARPGAPRPHPPHAGSGGRAALNGHAPSPWRASRERQRDREVKREAVIRAAAHAFNQKGYHNTSLDDIAAALEVTKPTVYYYVNNKEQLLFECFVAGVEQIRVALREVRDRAAPARERLNAVLRDYAQAMASEFGWCMVRVEDQDLSPDMSDHVKAMKSEIDHGIRRLIREGIQDGSIHPCDPKMAAFALAGSLNWIAHWYRENQSMSAAEIADAFIAMFDNGLQPRSPTDNTDRPRRRSARRSSYVRP